MSLFPHLDFQHVRDAHLMDTFEVALSDYREMLDRKGKSIATEALAMTRSNTYQTRRLRLKDFARHCFHLSDEYPIHPKALRFTEGALVMRSALRLYWTRHRQGNIKNEALDFYVDERIRRDDWYKDATAESQLLISVNPLFLDEKGLIEPLSMPDEDRDDGESRSLGAAWMCTVATPVELLDMPKNPAQLAKHQLKNSLKQLES